MTGTESMTQPDKTYAHMVRGSIWMIAMRWSMRGIGLVSTVILARLLVPADFGIVAMAMIVVGLFEIISWTGVDLALIRNKEADRAHYDAAWTIQIIQGALITALILLVSPFAGDYFNEPRVVPALQILAFRSLIQSFQNIGVVAFRKDLDFAKDFRFNTIKRLLNLVVIVALAITLRSYWALIIGLVTAPALEVMLSYRMHPFRPRWSTAKVREIWSFSQWLLLAQIGYFLNRKSDQFVIGGITGTTSMGGYYIAAEVAAMPSGEIVMPLRRAIFPTLAKIMHDPEQFGAAIIRVVGVAGMLCLSAGFGLAAVADDFVALLLGDQWLGTGPLVLWLAIYGAVAATSQMAEVVLMVTGKTGRTAFRSWLELAVLIPTLIVVANLWSIEMVAAARAAIAVAFVPLIFFMVSRSAPVTMGQLAGALWRPLTSAVVMFFVVRLAHVDGLPFVALRLVMDIAVGAVTFVAMSLALWFLSGRPEGIERSAIDTVVGGVQRLLGATRPVA